MPRMDFAGRTAVVTGANSGIGFATAQNLVVYSSVDEENATRLLDAFTEETGIDVQLVFLSSGPALRRLSSSWASEGSSNSRQVRR